MKQIIFKGKFTTLSPFCSSDPSDRKSNETETRKIAVCYGGQVYRVPFLSPNTIRSMLRDNTAKDIIEKFPNEMGYKELLFLTSGGNLEGKDKAGKELKNKTVLERIREIRNNNIVASIFGGALFHLNKLIPGKLSCGVGYLECRETTGREELPSFESFIGRNLQFVRSDDTDRWEFFSALSVEGVAEKEEYEKMYKESSKKRKEEKKKQSNEEKAEEEDIGSLEQEEGFRTVSAQMIWKISDYVTKDATFRHELLLVNPTPAEVGALIRAFVRFSEYPYLGCFKNIGFGKMKVEYDIYEIEEKTNYLGSIAVNDTKQFSYNGAKIENALLEYEKYLQTLTYDKIKI